jgi:carboxyl-terminal processing protease
MPFRNILAIGLAFAVCMASYSNAMHNRYASVFGEAMTIVEREALRKIPRRSLFEAAMDGMVKTLDANSSFISQDERSALEEDLNQQFVGVGMHFLPDDENDCLRVVAPIPGKPAWKAGIQVGDLIMAIDGKTTRGLASSEAINLIRGPLGQAVEFTIRRKSLDDDIRISIVREEIPVASVYGDTQNADGSWSFVLEGYPEIGYIRLLEFGRKSAEEMRTALQSINGKVDSLILDLRDNPGGLLDAAVEISDMFIGREVLIVQTRRRDNSISDRQFATSKTELDSEIPMVVLVNDRSASASEIVSACLQDHGRATIVGEQTYGKGTVQDLINLEPNRSMLRLTTASYWRPSGKNIDRTVLELESPDQYGVVPDEGFAVPLTDEDRDNIRIARNRRDSDTITRLANPNGRSSAASEEAKHGTEGPVIPVRTDDSFGQWLKIDRPLKRAIEFLLEIAQTQIAA